MDSLRADGGAGQLLHRESDLRGARLRLVRIRPLEAPLNHLNSPEPGREAGSEGPAGVVVCAAVIREGSRYLVGRRPTGKRHGGMWEFPGGKLLDGESFAGAMARELREELGLTVEGVGAVLLRIEDPGTPFSIHFAEVTVRGTPRPVEHTALAWCEPAELRALEMAPADARFVRVLIGDRAAG